MNHATPYATIIVEAHGPVGVIKLNRPEALNALSDELIADVNKAMDKFEKDKTIGCMVLTGSDKAFAAGADIKGMQKRRYPDTYMDDKFLEWDRISQRRKPIIAAVAGFALGGGCEVAMACDFIIAADTAKFGQPEIKLGVMPGAGGSQRMAKYIGKSKAMDLCLTGRMMDAAEAERCGLVSRVVPADKLMEEAIKAAGQIASYSQPIAAMTKDAVNRAFETTLAEGLRFERRLFSAMFGLSDQKEGMTAFIEKRKPEFKNR
jgi:enoyl-CoA hydratase